MLWSLGFAVWVFANPPAGTPGTTNGLISAVNGNIGINLGANTPTTPLHIGGNSNGDVSVLTIENLAKDAVATKTMSIDFAGRDVNNTQKKVGKITSYTDDVYWIGAGLSFYTRSGDASPTEKMRITSGGNVGIGTANPGYKLDVAGTGHMNQSIYSRATDGGATRFGLKNNAREWTINNYGNTVSSDPSVIGIFTINDESVPATRLSIGIDGTININNNRIANVKAPANATDAATKAYVDQQTTGANATRLWGEGRPGVGLVNGAGECTRNGIKISRSSRPTTWGSAAAACPKNSWVCDSNDRGIGASCGNGVGRRAVVCNITSGSVWGAQAVTSNAGWVSDSGSTGDYEVGLIIAADGGLGDYSQCSMFPVWCCSN